MSKKKEIADAKQRLSLIQFALSAIVMKIDETLDEEKVSRFERDLNNIYEALVKTIETMEDYFSVEEDQYEAVMTSKDLN
jgi:hypothetical protein